MGEYSRQVLQPQFHYHSLSCVMRFPLSSLCRIKIHQEEIQSSSIVAIVSFHAFVRAEAGGSGILF